MLILQMAKAQTLKQFLKILQAENNETAYQMANKLNVSPAFLSNVASGKAKMPQILIDKIDSKYQLSNTQKQILQKLQIESAGVIDFTKYDPQLQQMLINLACDYPVMVKKQKMILEEALLDN